MEVSDEFWDKWVEANPIEQVYLVESLQMPANIPPFLCHSAAELINSYLADLYDYAIRKDMSNVSSSYTQQAHTQGHPFNSCTD
jgi:hypothetical protein